MNMLNFLVACVAGSLGGVCWLLSRSRKPNFMWWTLRIAPLYFAIVSLIPSLNFWIVFWGGLAVVLVVAWLRGWRPRIVTSWALNVALSAILLPMAYTAVFIALAGICAMAEAGLSVALPKVGIESRQWVAAGMTDQMPFAIEYKAAHPFLAEYHKRIAFNLANASPLKWIRAEAAVVQFIRLVMEGIILQMVLNRSSSSMITLLMFKGKLFRKVVSLVALRHHVV